MKNGQQRLLGFAAVILVLVPMVARRAEAQEEGQKKDTKSLTGRYSCTGTDDRKNGYSIALEIRQRDEGFLLLWTHPDGRISARGLALRDASKLVVSFTNGRAMGVAHYTIAAGVLTGRWWAGEGSVLPEVCRPGEAKQARRQEIDAIR
jgi:hypothetical protein